MTNNASPPIDCRILILHDDPDSYLEALQARFPTIEIGVCRQADTVIKTWQALQPNIIFSWKSKLIPGEVQRPVLTASHTEWVQIGGAGFDHLMPLDGAQAHFTNCAGVLSEFLAETVLGAMLMLNFGFPRYLQQQRAAIWQQLSWTSVAGKTILIIGLGHIGAKVARHAQALGMRVLGIRNQALPVDGVNEMLSFEHLHEGLKQADFVSLHVPLTNTTRHLIDAEALSCMRPEAILINTARGGVVDEQALIQALERQQIAGAYLDVFATEPLPADNPLWHLPNVVISPHIADAVADWEQRFTIFFGDNLERWLRGDPLLNIVNVQRGY